MGLRVWGLGFGAQGLGNYGSTMWEQCRCAGGGGGRGEVGFWGDFLSSPPSVCRLRSRLQPPEFVCHMSSVRVRFRV